MKRCDDLKTMLEGTGVRWRSQRQSFRDLNARRMADGLPPVEACRETPPLPVTGPVDEPELRLAASIKRMRAARMRAGR